MYVCAVSVAADCGVVGYVGVVARALGLGDFWIVSGYCDVGGFDFDLGGS